MPSRRSRRLQLPAPLGEPWLLGAVVAFVAVTALGVAHATGRDAVSVLYCVPVALIAIRHGWRAGLAAAVAATVLVVVVAAVAFGDFRPIGIATRGTAFVLLGTLLGAYSERLGASERRFRTTLESAPVGIALVELDGSIRWANRALERLTGRSAADLRGTPLEALCVRDDRGDVARLLADARSVEPPLRGVEARLEAPGDAEAWVAIRVAAVRDPHGQPRHIVAHLLDITERKVFEHRLREAADRDPLTGLFNRRRLDEELSRHLARSARHGRRGALLLLDLDHFKYVNDSLGHAIGDELLRSVAGVLRDRLRESDVVARVAGDEFAILLPDADQAGARAVAASIIEALERHELPAVPGTDVRVTTSIGIVDLAAREDADAATLLVDADLAMYAAKERGRNRMAIHDAAANERARSEARLNWATRIRRALDEGAFVLERQPIIDLDTGEVVLYELLLRMVEGDELIPPGRFLGIAERYGLMPRIDRWVVREAVRLLATDPAGTGPRATVNLSSASLGDLELLEKIESRLALRGVRPGQLVFEVTETAAIARMDEARRFVDRLRELGCGFALDDFGAGFASFYYLKYLPFDYLKVDGEFVRAMTENPTDQLIVRAIVQTARGLGKRTIAEFVDDERTIALLRAVGVDYAQGFHLGRPAPVEEWVANPAMS